MSVSCAPLVLALLCAPFQHEFSRTERAQIARERQALLLAAYLQAPAAAREAVQSIFRRASGGVPAAYQPSFETLAQAWRALQQKPESSAGHDLQRWLDAVDCRLLPGAIEAEAPRPTPITVLWRALYATPLPDQTLEVVLHWIDPEGVESVARREPLDPAVLHAPSFEFYVHAPPSRSGVWQLRPSVSSESFSLQGWPVQLEYASKLTERAQAAQGEAAWLVQNLLERGVRLPPWRSLENVLQGTERVRAVPYNLSGYDLAGHELLAVTPLPDNPSRIVVVPALPEQAADALLAGPGADAWSVLAEEAPALVLFTDIALTPNENASLATLTRELRRTHAETPLVLVLRGPQVSALALALKRGEEYDIDACLQSSVLAPGSQPRAVTALPTLYVEVLVEQARPLPESKADLLHMQLSDPPFAADLWLPECLLEWWRRH